MSIAYKKRCPHCKKQFTVTVRALKTVNSAGFFIPFEVHVMKRLLPPVKLLKIFEEAKP
jgi:hypothetical protein